MILPPDAFRARAVFYPSADIGSDHQLLIASIRLKLKARKRHTASKRYDTKKLSDPLVAIDYQAEVAGKLTPIIDTLASNAVLMM